MTGGLAGAATDPTAFVDGLSVAFLVNAAIAVAAAAVAALTIAGGRPTRVRSDQRGVGDDHQAVSKAAAPASENRQTVFTAPTDRRSILVLGEASERSDSARFDQTQPRRPGRRHSTS